MRLCILFVAGVAYFGYKHRDVVVAVAKNVYYKARGVKKRKAMEFIE